MQETRRNQFNIMGNRAQLNSKLLQTIQSKPVLKSKSRDPIRSLRSKPMKQLELEEPLMQRALTTNKKLQPLLEDGLQSSKSAHNHEAYNPFRHNLIQLLVLMGKKEYYFDRVMKDDLKIVRGIINNNQVVEDSMAKIKKFIANKVRYKYRQTFKMQNQIQLEMLKYNVRKKNSRKQLDVDYENEDEESPKNKNKKGQSKLFADYATWKRKNDVAPNQKVFIIKSGYHDIREALLDRGWAENEDAYSPYFDLKWTCRLISEDYMGLGDHQALNHFDQNQCLISKYGLCRNIRCIPQSEAYFPRCYDLGDLTDFSDFIEDFKISKTHSILLEFQQNTSIDEIPYKIRYKVRMSMLIQQRINKSMKDLIKSIQKEDYPMVHAGEWLSMLREPEHEKDIQVQQYMEQVLTANGLEDCDGLQFMQKYGILVDQLLQNLSQNPQSYLQGPKNIWIIKPEYSSRGRGIRCHDDLYQIFDQTIGKENGYVAQKYIEHPLIIRDRKFDIRQWVVVTELVPLKIYFYSECYIRFSAEEYNMEDLSNRFVHLTNNAIAKHSSQFHQSEIKGNMWTQEQLQRHFIDLVGQDIFMERIQPKMKEIVISSLRCCSDQLKNRKKSFEVYGYDFMIDDQYNVWLIEVNMSPSTDTSTAVTAQLIPRMLEDVVRVAIDNQGKSKKRVGGYQLIYNSDTKLIL